MNRRLWAFSAAAWIFVLSGCNPATPPDVGRPSVDGAKPAADQRMTPFRCDVTASAGSDAVKGRIYFCSHYALEFDGPELASVATLYDLTGRWWQDASSPLKVLWQDCEAWAKASADRSQKSLAASKDENLNKFMRQMIDPQFNVTGDADVVTLGNDFLSYRATNPLKLDAKQREAFFAFDRINSYHKAMTERKVPPTPQLAFDDAMEKREFAPGKIEFTLTTPNGKMEVTIVAEVTALEPAEIEKVVATIQDILTKASDGK